MTDHDLNNLKNLPVPPARRGAREAAVAVALQTFKTAQARAAGDSQQSSNDSIRGSRRIDSRPRIAMAASLALIALAVPLVLYQHSTNQLHPGPVPHPSKSDRVITELQPGAADGQRNLSQIAATSGSPSEVARVPSSTLSLRDDAPVEVIRPADQSQQMARHFRLAELDPIRGPDVSARPRPEQGRERFDAVGPNPVKSVASEPVSTFSIDVDTASYAFVRRALNQGLLPPKNAVRVEELINYFPYRYPLPEKRQTPFQPTVTVLPSPWNPANKLVHIAVKGYDVVRTQRPRANLVLLIDTSGSMAPDDRLPLLKSAFRMLVDTPVTMKMKGFENGYTQGSFLWIVNNINFQYFSILITIISAVVMVAVSLMSEEPNYEKIKNLSFGTVTDEHRSESAKSWGWKEVAASILVLVVILGGYLYFRG